MGIKIKKGMAGSRCGKGRRETTATLKRVSKKRRRAQAKPMPYDREFEGAEYFF